MTARASGPTPRYWHRKARTAVARYVAPALFALAAPAAVSLAATGGTPDPALRSKLLSAFATVKSYRLTVLGSVRSSGVFNAPDRYEMVTDLDGKPVKTIIIGGGYWIYDQGKWQKSGNAGSSLDADIAGVIRHLKTDAPGALLRLPNDQQNGKPVGAFVYHFKGGTDETCNYDPKTYFVTRCRQDELTILYSDFNDPHNVVSNPH